MTRKVTMDIYIVDCCFLAHLEVYTTYTYIYMHIRIICRMKFILKELFSLGCSSAPHFFSNFQLLFVLTYTAVEEESFIKVLYYFI